MVQKFYYRNCSCCSGSGSSGSSGSGSAGSGSGSSSCECTFFKGTPCEGTALDKCDGEPLVATVTFSFQDCSAFYGGSFWQCSGSSASGAETGLAPPEESGSGSAPCLQECPNCCDLLPKKLSFNLVCVGNDYVSDNLLEASSSDPGFIYDTSCLGNRPDKKAFLYFNGCALDGDQCLAGVLFVPLDGFGLVFYLYTSGWSMNSCSPLDIRWSGNCGNSETSAGYIDMPCLGLCLGDNLCCVKANIVITEAGTGGGGGGGGGPVL